MIEGFKGQVLGILSYTWPTMVMGVVIAVLLRVTYLITEKRKIVIDSYIPSRILIDKPIISFENGYLIINSGLLIDRIYGIFFQRII